MILLSYIRVHLWPCSQTCSRPTNDHHLLTLLGVVPPSSLSITIVPSTYNSPFKLPYKFDPPSSLSVLSATLQLAIEHVSEA
ncbi:hypothetical protein L1987_61314 [Smallanthus sonchifolius]|uniref:Uncharacterized protein n=1 Tax=Smallanthus sonchifolius TaxID=185202 RepID=A0ACB9DAE2_9ASTR|nr:hypothetical protein L1987_61314 [Smallanthus sonchifolius]